MDFEEQIKILLKERKALYNRLKRNELKLKELSKTVEKGIIFD